MKKLLVLVSLVFCLTLLMAGSTLAAVHNFTSDFWYGKLLSDFSDYKMPSFEGWYYIEKDTPAANVRATFPKNGNYLGMEYFVNDQTFGNLTYADPDGEDSTAYMKASYLFDNHVFVGLDTASDNNNTQITVAPGYRFDLNKDCYVAVSMDYAMNHDIKYEDSGLVDFEVNGRYYTKDSRVYGQLIIPNKDVVGDNDTFILAGGAYKYSDNIVLGANLVDCGDYDYFEIGCTTAFDKLGAELRYIRDNDVNTIDGNVLYSFADNIRAGLEVKDVEDVNDLYMILKGKYTIDKKNSAVAMYQLKNGDVDSVISLRWDISL